MPKRGAIALALTSLALVLLFSFKTPDIEPITAGRNAAAFQPAASSAPAADRGQIAAPLAAASPAPNGALGAPSRAPAAPAATPATNGAPGAPNGAPAASPPAASPQVGATGAALADGTVSGSTVQTRFGPVQVQVTIAGGKIAEVTALQLPFDRQRSAEISQIVEPMLRSEALTAQSAQIDLVSGATYTSDAYARSLQSALDQAARG